jgi:hypothetical protein
MSPAKRRGPIKPIGRQMELLNNSGTPNFCFDTDVTHVPGSADKFKIGTLLLVLSPPPNFPHRALWAVVDGLCAFWRSSGNWNAGFVSRVFSVVGDWEYELSCRVTIRSQRDDGVISAILTTENRIELSLPHPATWRAHGLDWLFEFDDCCEQNRRNPTPWLGPACRCQTA